MSKKLLINNIKTNDTLFDYTSCYWNKTGNEFDVSDINNIVLIQKVRQSMFVISSKNLQSGDYKLSFILEDIDNGYVTNSYITRSKIDGDGESDLKSYEEYIEANTKKYVFKFKLEKDYIVKIAIRPYAEVSSVAPKTLNLKELKIEKI